MSQTDSKWRMYQDFYDLFVKANPKIPKNTMQAEANKVWSSLKEGKKVNPDLYRIEMTRLQSLVTSKRQTMLDYLLKPKIKKPAPAATITSSSGQTDFSSTTSANMSSTVDPVLVDESMELNDGSDALLDNSEITREQGVEADNGRVSDISSDDELRVEVKTPAQDRLNEQLGVIDKRLVTLNEARNVGLSLGDNETVNVAGITEKINDATKKRTGVLRSISKLKRGQKAQQKFRVKQRNIMKKVVTDFPDLASQVTVRDSAGRPPLEDSYPDLHKTVLDIATIGAAASDRRRQNLYRSVKTLDDLHSAVHQLGFKISRTALYYRLVPHSSRSNDGKRHVRTVPVK